MAFPLLKLAVKHWLQTRVYRCASNTNGWRLQLFHSTLHKACLVGSMAVPTAVARVWSVHVAKDTGCGCSVLEVWLKPLEAELVLQ